MDDYAKMATIGFKAEGDRLWLIGGPTSHLGQSLWLRELHGREDGLPPPVDLDAERVSGELIRTLIKLNLVNAVHDVSDGGILVAVTEMALAGNIGVDIDVDWKISAKSEGLIPETRQTLPKQLFGEDQGRYMVSTIDPYGEELIALAKKFGVKARYLGVIGGDSISIGDAPGASGNFAEIPLTALREASDSFFRDWMET
jgi:phosphoribosylformylglycinamidine (FGAM) synthase-like enzyme